MILFFVGSAASGSGSSRGRVLGSPLESAEVTTVDCDLSVLIVRGSYRNSSPLQRIESNG